MTETEFDQMAKELNEALDIEPNASHTQRLVTIFRLRSEVLRGREQAVKREQLVPLLGEFIDAVFEQVKVLKEVTDKFHQAILDRQEPSELDAQPPVDPADELREDVDPFGLFYDERAPEVRMDFPGPMDEKIGTDTTTDFVDARNRVPFHNIEVPLDSETRDWLKTMAEGGARDDG